MSSQLECVMLHGQLLTQLLRAGIPALIVAAASFDDLVAITLCAQLTCT